MAKDFKIQTDDDTYCWDRCSFRNNGIMIGSAMCQECVHHKGMNWKNKTVSCSKIIYRAQLTGGVIMRKNLNN